MVSLASLPSKRLAFRRMFAVQISNYPRMFAVFGLQLFGFGDKTQTHADGVRVVTPEVATEEANTPDKENTKNAAPQRATHFRLGHPCDLCLSADSPGRA